MAKWLCSEAAQDQGDISAALAAIDGQALHVLAAATRQAAVLAPPLLLSGAGSPGLAVAAACRGG